MTFGKILMIVGSQNGFTKAKSASVEILQTAEQRQIDFCL